MTPLFDAQVWSGTVVTQGVGVFVVTATGTRTGTGNIGAKVRKLRVSRGASPTPAFR